MNLELFTVLSQRFDRIENSFNLLQTQVNVLQSCIEDHFPEIADDLEAMYAAKLQAYTKERSSFPSFQPDSLNSLESGLPKQD